jgi:hypothetical protein
VGMRDEATHRSSTMHWQPHAAPHSASSTKNMMLVRPTFPKTSGYCCGACTWTKTVCTHKE